METVEIGFCDLIQRFRLWFPRRTETQVMSRDFWMPDQSCRVCYECETPFSLFNRRHHCRICGRIFCGRCTQNTLPITDVQSGICRESERVRACNFCFKLKQEECNQDIVQNVVVKPSIPSLTPSSSSFSLSSSGSSSSSHSTSTISTAGNPIQVSVAFGHKKPAMERIDPIIERKQRRPLRMGRKSYRSKSPKGRDLSPNPYDFCSNRSDDEETDDTKDGLYQVKRTFDVQSQEEEEDQSCVELKMAAAASKQSLYDFPTDLPTYINKVTSENDEMRCEDARLDIETIPHIERSLSRRSIASADDYEGPEESVDESNFYTPSVVQQSTSAVGEELVDVENNELIWVPPPPEEEELAMTVVDDDDDEEDDNETGWDSLSSSEYRIREKATASQEQRRAMRAVVDGHFRALVAQLLCGEGVEGDECQKDGWLEIVISLASQAASLFKPDTSKEGGGMDPGGYVKVKCIASGQRSDSCVLRGVVCKKNVAHKRMTLRYKNPRLLLLGGALEYQRVPNQLSSLDTLLQQEKEHLSMTASRIEAHHPNVVLVEKNVSRQAQEKLLSKEISLVLNVKRPLLERIARCTGAEIVPAPDQIMEAKLGLCDLFHVEKFTENLGSAGHVGKALTKTLMFFDGCPRPLGCTVLLRGANGDELKKLKKVVQFAVFAAYQVALETSFLVDERATLPVLSFKSPISVALPEKTSKLDRSISTVPGFLISASGSNALPELQSTLWSEQSSCFSSRNNSPPASPRASDAHDVPTRILGTMQSQNCSQNLVLSMAGGSVSSADKVLSNPHKTPFNTSIGFQTLPIMYRPHKKLMSASSNQLQSVDVDGSSTVTHMVRAASESEVTQVSDRTTGSLWEDEETNREEFPPSPSDHHSILVSFSSTCLRKRTVCERGQLFRIKYYGSFDKPLGKFLKEHVFDLNNVCGFCEETRDAHLHSYMHRQGSLTISVHCQNEVLSGEREGKIWMWHRCLKCPRVLNVPPATHRVLMSDAAWGLSFGKFLELSFSNHTAASRIAACGHSLHRDCLRFYGFGRMAACFRYIPINVLSVYLPPSKLEFNHPELDEWLISEFGEVTDKGKLIFAKAFNTLREIEEKVASSGISKAPEARRRIAQYETSLKQDQKAFLETLQKAAPMRKEAGDSFADVLKLNSTRRGLAALFLMWSQRIQVLRASLKLNKAVPTFRSANLDDRSLLLEIKEKMPSDAQEACNNSGGEVIEGKRPVSDIEEKRRSDAQEVCNSSGEVIEGKRPVSEFEEKRQRDAQEACNSSGGEVIEDKKPASLFMSSSMDEVTDESQNVCSSPLTYADKFEKSEIGAENEFAANAVESQYNGPLGGEDPNSLSEFNSGHVAVPVSPPCSQINDKTDVQASINSFRDSNKQDGTLLSTTEGLASVVGNKAKLEDENSGFSMNVLEEDDLLVRRTLSEGQFPVLPDLSDTFEAAWTGKGHTVEAHEVSISSTGQEITLQGSASCLSVVADEAAPAVASNAVLEVGTDTIPKSSKVGSSSSEDICPGSEGVLAGDPSSPLGNEKLEDFSVAKSPFSNLYRSYSKNSQYSFNGSPAADPQVLYSSYSTLFPVVEGRIFLPLGICDTVIPVYDDEPTSMIAYAITSHQYQAHLLDVPSEREKYRDREKEIEGKPDPKEKDLDSLKTESVAFHPLQVIEGTTEQNEHTPRDRAVYADEMPYISLRESSNLQYSKATHVKVSFTDTEPQGRVKFMVTCYYAKQFDALRKTCCSDPMDFIRSLCRCKKWGAQGGKSNVFFAKTRDDRFVIKQVTKTELESFIKFAPAYFKYISESLKTGSPTCLAKILGIFQVTVKHGKTGKEIRMDLMAMENLLYGRHVTRLYDLKGSLRSRYNADTTGKNKVLLDQNLLESMLSNPIFMGNKAKRILERAVWNDTSFLASVDVMDYSLLVGVDEDRRELVMGIIDFMRQYTWDKHLETWVKTSGILGGPKNATPTVISPKMYKKRFRSAMKNYFLMVPDQWSPAAEMFGPPHCDSVESFQSSS